MNNTKNKVSIITNGYFPVPAVMGGAVEALVENLIRQNETEQQLDLTVFSCYDKEAQDESKLYRHTKFEFIRIPFLIKWMDRCLFFAGRYLLRKGDSLTLKCVFQRLYFIYMTAYKIRKKDYGKLVLENHPVLFRILKLFGNDKIYKGRYYFHLHNEVTKAHGCEEIMGKCKKVLGVSGYINRTFERFLGRTFSAAVLQNKVDQKRFTVEVPDEELCALRASYDLKTDDVIVLFTGRFSPEKGVRELLDAIKKVRHEKVKLLVVGGFFFGSGVSSSFEKDVRELAEECKDKVRFTGYVDYAKIHVYYAMADMVVIPSIWDDPAPLTVIEALTCNKALITTYSGGIPEYADAKGSILLERDEFLVERMAASIDMLAYNPQKRKEMEALVKEKTKNWSLEQYYADFCSLLG